MEKKALKVRKSRTKGDRVLAAGRLVVDRASIPVLTDVAKRRGLGPSALMADIIDRWCIHIASQYYRDGRGPPPVVEPCAYPGCHWPLYRHALCRMHNEQRRQGQKLTEIRQRRTKIAGYILFLIVGPELNKRLSSAAAARHIAPGELARQLLEAGLP
jgi:hypothetical protein